MNIKITGLVELQHKVDDMERRAREFDGKHQIPMDELFPSNFLRRHSAFGSLGN
jgi:hypothetical protein